jgi:hypothetical protein
VTWAKKFRPARARLRRSQIIFDIPRSILFWITSFKELPPVKELSLPQCDSDDFTARYN